MLANALFLGIYFLAPLASILILHKAGFSFTRLSIPLLFFATYVVFAYVGILPLYYKLDSHAIAYGATDTNIMWQMLLLSASSMLMASVGTAIALHWNRSQNIPTGESARPLPLSGKALIFTCVLTGFCLIVTAVYIANVPQIPLFLALAGDQTAAITARATALTTNKVAIGKGQYFNVFIRFLAPFLAYIFLAHALALKKISAYVVCVAVFALTSFGLLLNTGKGFLLSFLVGALLVYIYAKEVKLSPRILLASGAGFVAVSALLVRFAMSATDSIFSLISYVATRITVGSLVPAYYVLEMFQKKDLLLGLSFPNPRGLLPYKQYFLELEVWRKIQNPRNPDLVYNAPAVFWSDMYINFGMAGPLISSLFIGLFLGLLNSFLERLKVGPVKTALMVWLGMHYMDLAVRSMFAYAWDYNMAMVLLAALGITFIDRHTTQKHIPYKQQALAQPIQ